jgi:hypothetical protein
VRMMHGIAFMAVTIGVAQYLSHIRIADFLTGELVRPIMLAVMVGLSIGALVTVLMVYRVPRWILSAWLLVTIVALTVGLWSEKAHALMMVILSLAVASIGPAAILRSRMARTR